MSNPGYPPIRPTPEKTEDAPTLAKPSQPNNANIWDFLDYYCGLKTGPGYAVLIKGPWGSGKTHLVENFFKAHPGLKKIYVSLYGVGSIADVESAFFAALHPNLSTPGMKIAASVIKGLLKNAKIDIDVFSGGQIDATGAVMEMKLPPFLSDAKNRVLIFDDLERCKMPLKEVMGYINAFVEHDDTKVILLANEDEILKPGPDGYLTQSGADYKDTKEKLIGKTFAIKADFPGAFEGFVAAVSDNTVRQFYVTKRGMIETLFNASEKDNLRVLRQTMLDFERLTGALEPAHRNRTEALGDVMSPYFALSFEMKANRIESEDVGKFSLPDWGQLLSGKNDSSQAKTRKRYPEVKFENAIIGMDVIRDALFDSRIDAVLIRERMANSKYFSAPQNQPPWRTLWYAMTLPDSEAQAAVDIVEKLIKEQAFTIQGEILHVVGERLWLARINAIPQSVADVENESIAYITALYKSGKLDPTKSMLDRIGRTEMSYGGLGFMERETKAFNAVAKHLAELEQKAAEDQYPAKSHALLEEMSRDTDLFVRRLVISNSEDNIYAEVPILPCLVPGEFVHRLLSLTPDRRRTVLVAFSARYSHLYATPKLVAELPWLEHVKALLEKEIAGMPAISKYALGGTLEHCVSEPLKAAHEQAANLAASKKAEEAELVVVT